MALCSDQIEFTWLIRVLAKIRVWTYALRTCSDATLGRATNSPRAANSQALPFPESPRQVNAGES